MPSTLPLSVTGPSAAVRPARRRLAHPLLRLGLTCLVSGLAPVGQALAAPAPGQPQPQSGTVGQGSQAAAPLAAAPAAANHSSPAQPATIPLQVQPAPPAAASISSAAERGPAATSGPAAAPTPASTAPASTAAPAAEAIPEAEFQQRLRTADLDRLNLLCLQLVEAGDDTRLRQLRERLLTIHPAPQPLPVVLANAEVLLTCRMPDGALTVLDRIGPARGAEQVQWLSLQWRAANAALDHRRAALALERLGAERPASLETLLLPLQQRSDGSWASRSALELLASHLESAGQRSRAASLLLLSGNQDAAAAERLAQAARLLSDLPADQREPLFERALEQAAAAGSWGLVGELLAVQATLPSSPEVAARTAERRLRLSRRLDDAYGEWLALQQAADPASEDRRQALRLQLRSPRSPGGHAESLPAPEPLPPPYTASQTSTGKGGSASPPARPPGADDTSLSPGPAQPPAAISPSGSPASSAP